MWILGALVAAAGTAVYVEFGTVRSRSLSLHIFIDMVGSYGTLIIGSPAERRRENIHGVRLSTPCVLDHLRIRTLRRVHRERPFPFVLSVTHRDFDSGQHICREHCFWRM